jgi:hypothetical protein
MAGQGVSRRWKRLSRGKKYAMKDIIMFRYACRPLLDGGEAGTFHHCA